MPLPWEPKDDAVIDACTTRDMRDLLYAMRLASNPKPVRDAEEWDDGLEVALRDSGLNPETAVHYDVGEEQALVVDGMRAVYYGGQEHWQVYDITCKWE